MAPRRRAARPAAKSGPSANNAPKVVMVESLDQWRALVAKAAASRRVLVVQFFQLQNWGCQQMRGYYRRMSVDGPLRAAIFAEVEVDAADPALLVECGVAQGATRIPHYDCYVDGEIVESYSGGVPSEVAKMITRQVAALKPQGTSLAKKLALAAAGAAALAGALWWRFAHGGGSGGGGGKSDLGAELRSVGDRIALAQKRLRNCERAGKLKAAKNQRRILKQLEAQRRVLEDRLQQRSNPVAADGGSGSGGGAARRAGGGGGKAARRAGRQAEAGGEGGGFESWGGPQGLPRYKHAAAAAAAYSDED